MNSNAAEIAQTSTAEDFLFNEGNIKVSKSRFIAGSETYAMSGISSVKSEAVPARAGLPLLLIIFGVIFLVGSSYVPPLLLIGGGIGIFIARSGQHSVTLGTSGGEIRSYVSRDKSFIEKVVNALNDAIIMRG